MEWLLSLDDEPRRRARRFNITMPVELEHGRGITRDVSSSGVFFESDHSFSVGEVISFWLVFEYAGMGPAFRLPCQGRVVRVEQRAGRTGVAVAFTSFGFEPAEESGKNYGIVGSIQHRVGGSSFPATR